MNALIIGLYGLYLLLVGFSGNSKVLLDKGTEDASGFLPWAISIGVLAIMSENAYTKRIAQPFIFLLILTFVVRNFEALRDQFNELNSLAKSAVSGAPKQTASAPTSSSPINTGVATGGYSAADQAGLDSLIAGFTN